MNYLTINIGLQKVNSLLLLKGLAFAFAIWHSIRILTIPFPIFGSDEYAFLAHSLYEDKALLYALDPQMQQISNPIFIELHGVMRQYAGAQGIYLSRFLHLLEWLGSIALILGAIPFFKNRDTAYWLMCCTMLTLPSSFFMLSLMPDTEMVFVFSILFFVISRYLQSKMWGTAFLSGVLCGIGLLIKPHAFAWLVAVMALFVLFLFNRYRSREFRAYEVLSLIVVLLSGYVTFIVGRGVLEGDWNLNPVMAVRQSVYGNILASPVQSKAMDWTVLLSYIAVHLLVLFFLFGFALFGMLDHLRAFMKKQGVVPAQISGTFLLLALGAVVCMVAYFTYGAGLGNAFEAYRVHGRYLLQLLIFIPLCSFLSLGQLTKKNLSLLGALGLVSSFLFYYAFQYRFKIYPWDYPELFAFYQSPNHYNWNYSIGPNMGMYVLLTYALSYILLIGLPTKAKYVLFAQFALLLFIGNWNMRDWSKMNSELYGEQVEAGKVIGQMIPRSEPGSVAVYGEQRFGEMAYFLSGLSDRHTPKVITKTAGSVLTSSDLTPYQWVILQKDYSVEGGTKKSLKVGNHVILSNELEFSLPQKGEWNQSPFFTTLGKQSGEIVLTGFNEREDWGAWTSSEQAVVELPFFINPGKLKFKVSGWLTLENKSNEVGFEIGKASFRTKMSDVNTAYTFEIDVKERTDRILLSTPVTRPQTSHRYTGVGIAFLEISR